MGDEEVDGTCVYIGGGGSFKIISVSHSHWVP